MVYYITSNNLKIVSNFNRFFSLLIKIEALLNDDFRRLKY